MWNAFQYAEKLPPGAQPPEMFELPHDITYIDHNNKCRHIRRKSYEQQRQYAEEQRRQYLITRHERILRQGRVHTKYDRGGKRHIFRGAPAFQDTMESKEDVMYDEDFTHFPTFGSGDYYLFTDTILHSYWSERFPNWRDNPIYILNAIQHVLEDWNFRSLLPQVTNLTTRTLLEHQLHQWIVYQLWQDPFLTLTEITSMIQQREDQERTHIDLINTSNHWTRHELEVHRIRIVDPMSESERDAGDFNLFSMRDRQRILIGQRQSYDIQLLQIRQHINPHEGSMIHMFTSRIVQFIQIQILLSQLHLTQPGLSEPINTLTWIRNSILYYDQSIHTIFPPSTNNLLPEFEAYLQSLSVPSRTQRIPVAPTRLVNLDASRDLTLSSDSDDDQPRALMMTDQTTFVLKESNSDPVFDTGSTAHMWNHMGHFTRYVINTDPTYHTKQADGTIVNILGIGDIGPLTSVLYVPNLTHCLISARALQKDGGWPNCKSRPRIRQKQRITTRTLIEWPLSDYAGRI